MAIPKGITLVAGGGFHVILILTAQSVLVDPYFRFLFPFFFSGKVNAVGRARSRMLQSHTRR